MYWSNEGWLAICLGELTFWFYDRFEGEVGGSFNSNFLRRSFLNLAVKEKNNYENWSTDAEVIVKSTVVYF